MKTIDEIKDEVAFEYDWIDWACFLNDCDDYEKDLVINRVINRVEQQYIDRVKELEELLQLWVMDMDERGKSYGDCYTMTKELLRK